MVNISRDSGEERPKYTIDQQIRQLYLLEKKTVSQISEILNINIDYIEKILKKLIPKDRSKNEYLLQDILQTIYPYYKILNEVKIDKYFMDFYIPKLRLCIEYDGIQHYTHNEFFHGKGIPGMYKFDNQFSADKDKAKILEKNNIYLIRIPHTVKINEQNVRNILNEHTDKIVYNLSKSTELDRTEQQDNTFI